MDMPTGNKSTVNFDFHGRTALVTGAGRGVGEEIARLFHASGARVAVSDIDGQAARQLADRLDDSGVSAMALTLDVRSKRAFEDARDRIASAWGRTDIVVNNAGYAKRTPVQDITTEEFDDIVAINMRSVFLSCQVFADHMRSNGWGRRALARLLEIKRTYPAAPFIAAVEQALQYGMFDLGRLETLVLERVAGDFFALEGNDNEGHEDDA